MLVVPVLIYAAVITTMLCKASVMGVLNDTDGKVQVVIDKAVADAEWFACNPGANTTHIRFKTRQLINSFLPAEKHKPEIIML